MAALERFLPTGPENQFVHEGLLSRQDATNPKKIKIGCQKQASNEGAMLQAPSVPQP
jgi:hypothetical protein